MVTRKSSVDRLTAGQISLFNVREAPDAFRKAVQVVHSRPKSPLSLMQRKLGNAWLKHAIEVQPDPDGWWELGIRDLSETIGFDSNNRQYLKEAADSLMRIVHEWDVLAPADRRVQWKASVLFPEIEITGDSIRYQISSQMRERLIHPEIYAMIDMNVVRRFRRAPSLAIWEFCVRFEKLAKTTEVEWETFRDMILGESAEGKTYQEYKYFKSKVLNPAIIEINLESNHKIELFETKQGKSVRALRFDVTRKVSAEENSVDDLAFELISELVKLGVPQSEARRLTKTYSIPDIRTALDYTRRRASDRKLATLANPAAYFRQALINRYTSEVTSDASEPKVAPVQKVDIKGAFQAQQAAQAERYFGDLDPGDQQQLIDRYNDQQETPTLRLKKKVTRVAQSAFFSWLAGDTWGEPTTDELLVFAQQMLAIKARS